ncbi:hypothetical protein BUALT_Bualt03G0160700 [Buddleja alternifolia]|uniref:Uncharacterized protein n=1 Tax=Buddleja alternifolia TaxID=168488 RepID=A0AAV6Y2A6_9LAMI|nr:hypothetical protein BUALT_Bualt03G0160700 [Buddleja alternifolia]
MCLYLILVYTVILLLYYDMFRRCPVDYDIGTFPGMIIHVQDLEKDILEAKQKIQFYHAKMQELAESLAKKYEEKYKQAGDVASKLTIEEATFRDIQEKKMELYRAIVKLEQHDADGIQDRANEIQSDLEELVKALNDRCKTYGLRGKPTSLVELPFGWQPGIQGAAADWDEVWDKFEDEGFTHVKELTLEVQNIIAPPKPKSALIREKVTSLDNITTVKSPSKAENERSNKHKLQQIAATPPDSPAGSNAVESPSKEFHHLQSTKDINVNGSSHIFDTQSEFGGAESVLSGDKGFDEPGWGSFDTHYDTDSAWDFNPVTPKGERHTEGSLFSPDDWGLNPIRTGSKAVDSTLPRQGPFFDSVPSTPLYSSTNSPQADNNMFTRNSPFFDSAPSTPLYNSSPRKFSEGSEEQYSFDSFSRFDSFNMNDSGPFGSSRESLTRFDSMRSTRDSDFDQGHLARFDSFRSTADSDYNFGLFQPRESFTRFDSMRSTRDSDYGHSFPSFDDAADPFGSSDPFRTTHDAQTPRKDSDGWKAF